MGERDSGLKAIVGKVLILNMYGWPDYYLELVTWHHKGGGKNGRSLDLGCEMFGILNRLRTR